MIPFMDLKKQYETIKSEISEAINSTVASMAFVGGKKVKEFEDNFARYCGVKHAIGVSNGTCALYAALRILDIGKGDAVICVSNTFIATIEAITYNGARPIFIDIDEASYNIDCKKVRDYIKNNCIWGNGILTDKKSKCRIKAILPVHLYGQMANMGEIMDIAKAYNMNVIEDCAQAHGAEFKGRHSGSFGNVNAFSFYPSKNLGAYGQGGMILTNDDGIAEKLRMLIDHGQKDKNKHTIVGWNFKMDGLQAAVLNVKLSHLEEWNNNRRNIADRYRKNLAGIKGIILPSAEKEYKHVYHLFVARVKNRDGFMKYLADHGVGSAIHYPVPVHLQPAYGYLDHKPGDFPVTEKCVAEIVSLPMFPELGNGDVDQVCSEISNWFKNND